MGDQDYARLEQTLLRLAPQGAMSLEKLDGFFTALLAGPEMLSPSEYLPLILGEGFDDESAFSEKAFAQFARQLRGHWQDVAHGLQAAGQFAPWLTEDAQGQAHALDWAEGFYEGMQLMPDDWALLFDDAEHAPALAPILALAFVRHPDAEMRPFLGEADPARLAEWVAQLGEAAPQIYRFFATLRAKLAAEAEQEED